MVEQIKNPLVVLLMDGFVGAWLVQHCFSQATNQQTILHGLAVPHPILFTYV